MSKGLWPAVLLGVLAMAVSAEGIVWDFEIDLGNWRPRVSTVSLRRIGTFGATQASGACLEIVGTAADRYSYAISNETPLQAGQWYRLTGWLRVDSAGRDTPMPYFKCQFLSGMGGTGPGIVVTDPYNNVQIGLWQHLSRLFQAPAGVTAGIVALEKGTTAPTEIHAFVDDVSVEAVSETEIYQQYSIPGLPESLSPLRGVHPRLFLNDRRIADLRESIRTTHAALWSEVRDLADDLASAAPPAYTASPADLGQLWQRPVGNAMPYLALAYLLTGQTKYLDGAKRWALASCDYPQWGIDARDGTDLAAGHQLFGLALVYDWCYDDLDESTRDRIRSTLISRSNAMFRRAAREQLWWHNLYMQNHLWVNICGLGAAGLAVFEETEDAPLWIGMAIRKLETTLETLGPDGASHEGVGYWEYGAEHMLKLMSLVKDSLGIDLYDSAWWKNTAQYSLYLTLPGLSWSRYDSVVNLADSPRHHWYGPDHILRHLATTYDDGHAQWLADQIDWMNVESSNAQWLNLIWYDPAVAPQSPRDLPTLHHFIDMGIVSARTGWTGSESLVVFKCGPFIGHKAIQTFCYDPGGGHTHPDAGHFILFGNGEWLIRDDGVGPKWTSRHNTLLIDGVGQLGEGGKSFLSGESLATRARPRILAAESNSEYDYIAADVAPAYPRNLGVARYVRHLLFLKPDVLLILDDVVCDAERDLELRFHAAGTTCETADGISMIAGARTLLRLELLTPEDAAVQAEQSNPEDPVVLRCSRTVGQWRNVVALSWANMQNEPRSVAQETVGDVSEFRLDDRTITFDWTLGKATPAP